MRQTLIACALVLAGCTLQMALASVIRQPEPSGTKPAIVQTSGSHGPQAVGLHVMGKFTPVADGVNGPVKLDPCTNPTVYDFPDVAVDPTVTEIGPPHPYGSSETVKRDWTSPSDTILLVGTVTHPGPNDIYKTEAVRYELKQERRSGALVGTRTVGTGRPQPIRLGSVEPSSPEGCAGR